MMSVEELKAWKFEKENDKSLIDDDSKKHIIDDDKMFNEKIFNGPKFKKKDSMNKLFKHLPGETKIIDNMNKQKLSLFGDKDKDKILNVFDKNPFKKNKRML